MATIPCGSTPIQLRVEKNNWCFQYPNITLSKFITMVCGTDNIPHIQSEHGGIFYRILSCPQNTIMDPNIIMNLTQNCSKLILEGSLLYSIFTRAGNAILTIVRMACGIVTWKDK